MAAEDYMDFDCGYDDLDHWGNPATGIDHRGNLTWPASRKFESKGFLKVGFAQRKAMELLLGPVGDSAAFLALINAS